MFGNQPKTNPSEEEIMENNNGNIQEEIVFEQVEDLRSASIEQIDRALQLLNRELKRKAEGKGGGGKKWSEMTEEEKDVRRGYNVRRNARIKLILQKAEEQKITVTEEEIDEFLLKEGKV